MEDATEFLKFLVENLKHMQETTKNNVVVLGSKNFKEDIITKITSRLVERGYVPYVAFNLTEFVLPDHFTPRQRIYWFLADSCFVIAEDTVPSGEMVELEYCKNLGVTTAILHDKNLPRSSWMTLDVDIHCSDFSCFSYDKNNPEDLEKNVDKAIDWALKRNEQKRNDFSEKEKEWKEKNKVFLKPEVIEAFRRLKEVL